MLMDEPFGALDPITRARLQDEFLRLQSQVGKTVVFVTHDIDEAIKMGDKVAVLREGGRLAQYDSPDAILGRPVDEFVAQFVGADRGLKRLSLRRVGDLELLPVPPGESPATNGAVASPDMPLRDALSIMLSETGSQLAVVDDDRVTGYVTADLI